MAPLISLLRNQLDRELFTRHKPTCGLRKAATDDFKAVPLKNPNRSMITNSHPGCQWSLLMGTQQLRDILCSDSRFPRVGSVPVTDIVDAIHAVWGDGSDQLVCAQNALKARDRIIRDLFPVCIKAGRTAENRHRHPILFAIVLEHEDPVEV